MTEVDSKSGAQVGQPGATALPHGSAPPHGSAAPDGPGQGGERQATIGRTWALIKPFFFSEIKWHARGMLLLLILFSLSIAGVNYAISFRARDFMTAFELKEKDQFFEALLIYLFAFAAAAPVVVFYSYTEQRLAVLWRRWLSRSILEQYFTNLAFYRVSWAKGIDNPDQRLEEDIRSFTATSLSLFLIMLNAVLTLVLFVGILWSISPNLLIAVVGYALFGSLITLVVGRTLVGLNFSQLKKEADYRYKLVNVRDHAEEIAFYRGNRKEFTRTRQKLKVALENFRRIINVNRNLNFFITIYNNLKPVIPVVVVFPLYLSGNIKFGVVYQATDAFVRVVEALSILVQHFGTISAVTAVVSRLSSFTEALDEAAENPVPEGASEIHVITDDKIKFENVTIYTPRRDQMLIRNLSLEHARGGLLFVGPSGSGKSSLMRVLAGLWSAGEGTVTRPPLEQTFFIPQRPYLVLGTLRNQLLYTTQHATATDDELLAVLDRVNLNSVVKRVGGLNASADWSTVLSTGEQQQIAFARLVLARPRYAFLDEATTAVDARTEKRLYAMVSETAVAHISIGYRSTLGKFHHEVIALKADGSWAEECIWGEEDEE